MNRVARILPLLALRAAGDLATAEAPPARRRDRCSHGQNGVSGGVRTCLACGATQTKGFSWIAARARELSELCGLPLEACSDAVFAIGFDRALEAAVRANATGQSLREIVRGIVELEGVRG